MLENPHTPDSLSLVGTAYLVWWICANWCGANCGVHIILKKNQHVIGIIFYFYFHCRICPFVRIYRAVLTCSVEVLWHWYLDNGEVVLYSCWSDSHFIRNSCTIYRLHALVWKGSCCRRVKTTSFHWVCTITVTKVV